MLVLLTVANRRTARSESLVEASGRLDALRITLRLSKRLGFLPNGGYERLSEVADEVGSDRRVEGAGRAIVVIPHRLYEAIEGAMGGGGIVDDGQGIEEALEAARRCSYGEIERDALAVLTSC